MTVNIKIFKNLVNIFYRYLTLAVAWYSIGK